MPVTLAASSMFRWVSSAAIASSFLRPNFPPGGFISPPFPPCWPFRTAASPPPHRESFASVDFLHNSLAFQALRSDPCDDRAERGTKENDYEDTYDRRAEQHHGVRHPRGS